ncbi:uncharacterized protein LOC142340869 isoform X2 [Convolutriloba macropyga]|uniref:uncharacterized protein LOC142340869 isoform X2 n=1 Tax=Convolutriloba macropyga TaxID=536237 RepID=UPI003F5236BE
MLSILLLLLFRHVAITLSADTVVSPKVSLNWTSQTFVFPPGALHTDAGAYCGMYSKYYCLHAYETRLTRFAAIAAHIGASLTQIQQANRQGPLPGQTEDKFVRTKHLE